MSFISVSVGNFLQLQTKTKRMNTAKGRQFIRFYLFSSSTESLSERRTYNNSFQLAASYVNVDFSTKF